MAGELKGLLGRLIGGGLARLGGMQGHFRLNFLKLDDAETGLAARTAAFVADGGSSAVLSSLAIAPVRAKWTSGGTVYPRSKAFDGAFGNDWHPDVLARLGDVIAALEPVGSGPQWGLSGTSLSPEWLRRAIEARAAHDKPVCRFAQLQAMVEARGFGAEVLLDIVLHPSYGRYGIDHSLDLFPGVDAWLGSAAAAVIAAAPRLDAKGRTELARAIGRYGLTGSYLALLVDQAVGPAKSVREAAAKALTGADPARLAALLTQRHAASPTGTRIELVKVAASTLGAGAVPLLAGWQAGETEARPREAIAAALATLQLAAAPAATVDGAGGYRALDGSMVTLPPCPPLPPAATIPEAVFDLLRPAMASYNAAFETARRAAPKDEKWHWTRHAKPVDESQLRKFGAQLDGKADRNDALRALLWSHTPAKFDRSGVTAFLQSPALTLRHLVAYLAVAQGRSELLWIINGTHGNAVAGELTRRWLAGADLRVIAALWREQRRPPPLADYLAGQWGLSVDAFDADAFWPLVADGLDAIDEALGLRPQAGERPLMPGRALDLLGVLPKVPQRYLLPLMGLATGSAKGLREAARQLLAGAPDIDAGIARLLGDGKQEVRAGAADWLAARAAQGQVPALRDALQTERSDVGRAALITALERLGDDVGDCFDRVALLAEAKAGLKKTATKPLDWFPFDRQPQLNWADGTAVDPAITRWWIVLANKLKQPGGNVLLDMWLARLAPGDAARLGLFVLLSWIERDTDAVGEDAANAHAAANVDARLAANQAQVRRNPRWAEYYPTDRALLFAQLKRERLGNYLGSAADNKGLLALATRVDGGDAGLIGRAYLKDHGARVSQAKAILEALAANPAPAAIQVVLATANRFKARTVQEHAAALVETIAERRGWTPQELADRTVPVAGFDERGEAEIDCGADRIFRLVLGDNENVTLLNPAGAVAKALPGPRGEGEADIIAAARKQLAQARKELKLVVPAQTARLREAMCLERCWPVDDWQRHLLGHPIVGRLARRLVWIGRDAADAAVSQFRPLDDGSFAGPDDAEVSLAGVAAVQLAHASIVSVADAAAWAQHLVDYEVAPPFDQFGRTLPVLAAAQRGDTAILDRKGWMIETFKLRGIAGKLGYGRGAAEDGGVFSRYERRYDAAGLVVAIEFSGSPLPEENMAGVLYEMQVLRLARGNRHGHAAVPLGEVPPVLLAESWQDLHDIAAAGTGFDKDWEKKSLW